jgi:hypothetical protein
MTDHIAALEAALHTEAMNLPLEVLFGVLAEVKRLREELAATEARADMHADLGRRTADALGIPLEEGRAHMPEVALRLRAENETFRQRYVTQTAYDAVKEELAAVRAEVEALRRPLTDEEILGAGPGAGETWGNEDQLYFARAIEAAHIKAAQAAKEK